MLTTIVKFRKLMTGMKVLTILEKYTLAVFLTCRISGPNMCHIVAVNEALTALETAAC